MQVLFSLNTGPQCPIWGISGRLILGKSKKFSSLREVRLVSRSVLPENEEEHRTGDGCGRNLPVPFAFYDPLTSSLRMSQGSFFREERKCSLTLPASGTMRNGQCFRLHNLGPHTSGAGSSSWPTPTASMVTMG